MKKIVFGFIAVTVILIVAASNLASAKEKTSNIPDHVKDKLPVLEKRVFIHYKKGFVKPNTECGNGVCEPGENANKCPTDCGGGVIEPDLTCYGFLTKGLKIKSPKVLTVAPGLEAVIGTASNEWDFNVGEQLFNGVVTGENVNWDDKTPDGRNEFSFGSYPEDGVIAVTVTWGYYSAPPPLREITEFDVLFNNYYSWGNADDDPTVMDLQNIATHEIGHGVGMADVYQGTCSDVTMYGYSDYGETEKRDLAPADIVGLNKLY